MGRYDLAPEDMRSIVDAAKDGEIARAVELANRLIWEPFNRGPSGQPVGWIPMASEKKVRALLECRPKILKSIPEGTLAVLNFAAVMGELLGPRYRESEWLPEKLDLGLPMKSSSAVNMFQFCVRHYDQLGVYARSGFNRLRIHVCHNVDGSFPACAVCETLTGTIWTADTIPELPYEQCVNSFGCRCLAMVDCL
jgi:hypothetical protein